MEGKWKRKDKFKERKIKEKQEKNRTNKNSIDIDNFRRKPLNSLLHVIKGSSLESNENLKEYYKSIRI